MIETIVYCDICQLRRGVNAATKGIFVFHEYGSMGAEMHICRPCLEAIKEARKPQRET